MPPPIVDRVAHSPAPLGRVAHGPLGHTAYWANGLHTEVDRCGPRGPDDGLQDDMQGKVRFPRLPSGLVMWCVLYDLGCVLCCVYDLVWNLKTYLRNVLDTGQVRLWTTAPIY